MGVGGLYSFHGEVWAETQRLRAGPRHWPWQRPTGWGERSRSAAVVWRAEALPKEGVSNNMLQLSKIESTCADRQRCSKYVTWKELVEEQYVCHDLMYFFMLNLNCIFLRHTRDCHNEVLTKGRLENHREEKEIEFPLRVLPGLVEYFTLNVYYIGMYF